MPGRHAHFNATIFQKLIIAPYEVDNIRTLLRQQQKLFFRKWLFELWHSIASAPFSILTDHSVTGPIFAYSK